VLIARIREDRTFGQQTVESGVIFRSVAGQVIVSELIEDHGHYQLRFSRRGVQGAGNQQPEDKKAFHF
jgi:hypothetical protein